MSIPAAVLFDGGSITMRRGVTGSEGPYNWPEALIAQLGWTPAFWANRAAPGKPWHDIVAEAPSTIDPHVVPGNSIACAFQGYADLTYGIPAIHIYNRWVRWNVERRSLGFRTVAATMLPGGRPVPLSQATFNERREELNDRIRTSHTTFADAFVDVALDANIGAEDAWQDTTYFWDDIHLSDAGIVYLAGLFRPAFEELAT